MLLLYLLSKKLYLFWRYSIYDTFDLVVFNLFIRFETYAPQKCLHSLSFRKDKLSPSSFRSSCLCKCNPYMNASYLIIESRHKTVADISSLSTSHGSRQSLFWNGSLSRANSLHICIVLQPATVRRSLLLSSLRGVTWWPRHR